MRKKAKTILTSKEMNIAIDRLCYQLIEHHNDFKDSCIIGIQFKGALLAERLHQRIIELTNTTSFLIGKIDITFSRDDFKSNFNKHNPYPTEINFLIESKKVILVDDVLYTGRTIQAALQELQNFGRPAQTELLVFIDRRFNRQVPIQADYYGIRVDALDESYVKVDWQEVDGSDRVLFYEADRL